MKKQFRNRLQSFTRMLPPHSVSPSSGKPPVHPGRTDEPGLPPVHSASTERFTTEITRERVASIR